MRAILVFFTLWTQAVEAAIASLRTGYGFSLFSLLSAAALLGNSWARGAVRLDSRSIATWVAPFALVAVGFLGWHLVRVPYEAYERQRVALQVALNVPSRTSRATQDALSVVNAFRLFRAGVRDGTPTLILTSEDSENELYMVFAQAAVAGSNLGNGNLANLGVDESSLQAATSSGAIAGVVVLHANTNLPWALQLEDDLKGVLPVKRSFDFPVSVDNATVWIQIGKGTRWNADPRPSEHRTEKD